MVLDKEFWLGLEHKLKATLGSGIVVLVGIIVLVGTFDRINKHTGGHFY